MGEFHLLTQTDRLKARSVSAKLSPNSEKIQKVMQGADTERARVDQVVQNAQVSTAQTPDTSSVLNPEWKSEHPDKL